MFRNWSMPAQSAKSKKLTTVVNASRIWTLGSMVCLSSAKCARFKRHSTRCRFPTKLRWLADSRVETFYVMRVYVGTLRVPEFGCTLQLDEASISRRCEIDCVRVTIEARGYGFHVDCDSLKSHEQSTTSFFLLLFFFSQFFCVGSLSENKWRWWRLSSNLLVYDGYVNLDLTIFNTASKIERNRQIHFALTIRSIDIVC